MVLCLYVQHLNHVNNKLQSKFISFFLNTPLKKVRLVFIFFDIKIMFQITYIPLIKVKTEIRNAFAPNNILFYIKSFDLF